MGYGFGHRISIGSMPIVSASPAPAPSGLPVSSTPAIAVVGSGGVLSAIYDTRELEQFIGTFENEYYAGFPPFYSTTQDAINDDIYIFLGPNASLLDYEQSNYYVNGSSWQIMRLFDNEGTTLVSVGTNPSTNADYIPTSGWTPSITITAAPSGIPVATTSSVIVSSSPDGFNGTYDKVTEQYYAEIIDGNKQIVWNSEDVGVPNRWSLANFDTNFFVTHQTWSDQTQIPASGWPNGEIITAD